MLTGITHLHSVLRWFALIAIVVAIVRSFQGMSGGKDYTAKDNRWSLITLIVFHLQLVLGLVLYFAKGWYTQIGEMSNPVIRFWSLEHLVAMLIAITLVTVGRVSAKKTSAAKSKHTKQFWFFLIAFLIVMANIPWPFREAGIARGLFPGM
jgi:hypothetical protein